MQLIVLILITEKYNYIGNHGIHWVHPESPFIIRVTDDYERCVDGNKSNDNTCWWYFSDRSLQLMKKDFNTEELIHVQNEIRNWKSIQTTSAESIEFAVNNSRIYAAFSNVPIEQKVFAVKQYNSTFFTDDPMEHLNSNPEFSPVANEYVNNLRKIWNGVLDQKTDLNQFKGQSSDLDVYIDKANLAIDIQIDMGILAEKLLKPKLHDLYKAGALQYLNGCIQERPLFHKHVPNKTYISETEGRDSRQGSIGIEWVIACNLNDENAAPHLTTLNPVVRSSAWIVAMENDVISYCKEKYAEYSPMSFCYKLIESGNSELEAARNTINRSNEAKRANDIIWKNTSTEFSPYYEHMARLVMAITDWNFVLGLRNCNTRYGWMPKTD